jgi:hypothetical protein
LHEAEQNKRFAAQVRASAGRVLALKKKSTLATRRCPAPTQAIVDKLRREIWEFSEEVRLVKASM